MGNKLYPPNILCVPRHSTKRPVTATQTQITIKKGYFKYRDCDETLAIASRKKENFDAITMEETEVKTPFENHTLPGEVKPKSKT